MRILVVGGVRSASGYGRVVREVGRALAGLGEIVFVQVGQDDGQIATGPVLSTPYPYDFVSYRFIPEVIRDWAPDVTLIIHDLAYCAALVGEISCCGGKSRLVTYCPFEGILAHTAHLPMLLEADTVVLYSQHDVGVLRGILTAAHPPSPEPSRAQIFAIPHGVDQATFRPVLTGPLGRINPACRDVARRVLLGEIASSQISFLVLNANKNIGRKRIDATLRVFAAFAADKPSGVKLLLKSSARTSDGCDIAGIVQALGLEERVLTTEALGMPDTLDDAAMNRLYNAADVGMNTSEGEGWGLIPYEHAACGIPQILPAHPTTAEYWSGYAGLIRVSLSSPRGGCFLAAEIDEPAALDVLERLYRDEPFREQAGLEAMAIAGRPDLAWSAIGETWKDLVNPAFRQNLDRREQAEI